MIDWHERAIASVRAGAPDVEAIYMAYCEPMLGTAAAKLGGVDGSALGLSAEDVVEDVVVGLLDGSIELDPSVADHLKARLRRIVANQAIDLVRRSGAQSRARVKRHPTDDTDLQADVETMVLAGQAEDRMFVLNEREHYVIVEHIKKGTSCEGRRRRTRLRSTERLSAQEGSAAQALRGTSFRGIGLERLESE